MKKYGTLLLLLLVFLTLPKKIQAREPDYCFSSSDLGENLMGICLREIPREGILMLENRSLRPGDVLTAAQAENMTYHSTKGFGGRVTYLPISEDGLLETASFFIPGRENQPPVAEDSLLETYRNLQGCGRLKVRDPEQKNVTVTLVRSPRRGEVEVLPHGKFTYTPHKNKVGTDSFTYRASDPEGNVSREATVTVTILKPSEAPAYRDTMSLDCSFSAEWMKNTGIFVSENVGQTHCFYPAKTVSRGEYLTMLLKTMEISPEKNLVVSGEECPVWLQPYAAAAVRWGITAGIPRDENWDRPITEAEAAVMAENALDLPVPALSEEKEVPVWAAASLAALRQEGVELSGLEPLTRGTAAELLYRIHLLKLGA